MCVHMCVLSHFSRVQLCATPLIVARQAPLSTGFSKKEYWSGLPRTPPGHLPDPGIKPASLLCPALAGGFLTASTTWGAPRSCNRPYVKLTKKHTVFPLHPKCLWHKRLHINKGITLVTIQVLLNNPNAVNFHKTQTFGRGEIDSVFKAPLYW